MTEEDVARRIDYEMRLRGWSQERLAREMSNAGHPLHQSAISKIVNPRGGKRRAISVDEAIGFARVFGVSLDSLLLPLSAVKVPAVRWILGELEELSARQRETDERIAALRSELDRLPADDEL